MVSEGSIEEASLTGFRVLMSSSRSRKGRNMKMLKTNIERPKACDNLNISLEASEAT